MSKLFAEEDRCEELFHKVCDAGCEREVLAGLLFAVSTLAVGQHEGWAKPETFSTTQVKKIATELRWLATSVKQLNNTQLNPKYDLLWAAPDPMRDEVRKIVARFYDMLPGIMMTYSFHLERFLKFRRLSLKRLTLTHANTLELLRYVQEKTGGPRYEDLSNLLNAGFLVAGGSEKKIPKIFSADALSKLKQRWTSHRHRKR
jgi:hypothetical protein